MEAEFFSKTLATVSQTRHNFQKDYDFKTE
jgi:hypothetical protein